MKKIIVDFILNVLDKTFKFLSKLKCNMCCCNSNCSIDKSVNVECNEECSKDCCKEQIELKKSKSESSLDSLKSK